MAADTQVSELDAALAAAASAITTLSKDVSLLVTALQNHPAAPDLTKEIAAAQALSTGIESIDAGVNAFLTPVSVSPGTGTTAPAASDTISEAEPQS